MFISIKEQKPLITIVTVVYNAENTIYETINSVISQTYDNIQYVIIDGGSNDGTFEKINFFKDKIDVLISKPDKGIFDAMNKGILHAKGKYINFMNSGDLFADSKVIENLVENSNIEDDFIYGDTIFNKKGVLNLKKANPFFKKKGINAMGICHQSIFIKTELARKYKFDTNFKLTADYKMIYLIFKNENIKTLYLNSPISIFDSSFGVSSKQYRRTFKEIIDIYFSESLIKKMIFLIKSNIRCSISVLLNFIQVQR